MPSTLILGVPGFGKSYTASWLAWAFIRTGKFAVIILDRHGRSTAWLTLLRIMPTIHRNRLHYENLRATDRVVRLRLLTRSKHPCPAERRLIDQMTIDNLVEVLASRQDLGRIESQPVKERGIGFALKLWLLQPKPYPQSWLRFTLYPKSRQFRQMLETCECSINRIEGYRLEELSEHHQSEQLMPARRFLEGGLLDAVLIQMRLSDDASFDIGDHSAKCGITLIEAQGAPDSDVRIIFSIHLSRLYAYLREGAKYPVVLVLDECQHLALLNAGFASILEQFRKLGLTVIVVMQRLDLSDGVHLRIFDACPIHLYHRVGYEMAEMAARDLCELVHEDVIHRIEEHRRQRLIGYEAVPIITRTISQGISASDRGKRKEQRESINESVQFRPMHQEVTEYRPVYQSPQDQRIFLARQIQMLKPRQFLIRDLEGTREGFTPKFHDPCGLPGLAEKKAERWIKEYKTTAAYGPPLIGANSISSSLDSAKPTPSQPKSSKKRASAAKNVQQIVSDRSAREGGSSSSEPSK